MNIRKIVAAALSLAVMCVSAPVEMHTPEFSGITASAAGTTVTQNGLTFNVYSDHAEVIRAESGASSIPSSVDGVPVTVIADTSFAGSSIGSISIPDTVTVIGKGAFSGCVSLGSITLPASVSSIGNNAFGNCKALKRSRS